MKNWKEIIFMLLAGLGWAAFGGIVLHTEVFNFWIGWVSLAVGIGMFSVAVDKATEQKDAWRYDHG